LRNVNYIKNSEEPREEDGEQDREEPEKNLITSARLELSETAAAKTSPDFTWARHADLPAPGGLKGMYAGLSHGRVILAGGSYFPVPASQGGKKEYARRVFTRPADAPAGAAWEIDAAALPAGLGEGASVTTEHGVVVMGGNSEAGPVADVFLLKWDGDAGRVARTPLPPLPEPVANAAAVCRDGKLYIIGGENSGRASRRLMRLDLAAATGGEAGAAWRELPPLPGTPRCGAAAAVLRAGTGERLFVFGGRAEAAGRVVETDYLADGFSYDFETGAWAPAAPLPWRALLPAAARTGAGEMVVMGGSDGSHLARVTGPDAHPAPALPDHMALYDAGANQWRAAGRMPLGAVSAAVADLGGRWLVAGGEPAPGLRTRTVYIMEKATRQTRRQDARIVTNGFPSAPPPAASAPLR
jgi:N-acetylneuraminic acid mutarotase